LFSVSKRRILLTLASVVCVAVILVVGLSVGLRQPLYTSQGALTPTYLRPYERFSWNTGYLNDTHGKEIAEFSMMFRSDNQSLGPVLLTVSFSPNFDDSVQLDSVKLTFTSDSFGNWPDIGVRVPLQGGSTAPGSVVRGNQ
jgi:hypothetical protein